MDEDAQQGRLRIASWVVLGPFPKLPSEHQSDPREIQSLLPIPITLTVFAQPLLHFSFLSQGVFILEILAI